MTAAPVEYELRATRFIRARSAGLFGATSLALSLLCPPALAADVCAFPASSRVISNEGPKSAKSSRVVQVWDVHDAAVYWSTAEPIDPAYDDFLAGVAKHVPVTDPVALLRASRGIEIPRLKQSNALVAERAADWIHPSGDLAVWARPAEFIGAPGRRRRNDYNSGGFRKRRT